MAHNRVMSWLFRSFSYSASLMNIINISMHACIEMFYLGETCYWVVTCLFFMVASTKRNQLYTTVFAFQHLDSVVN